MSPSVFCAENAAGFIFSQSGVGGATVEQGVKRVLCSHGAGWTVAVNLF